MWKVLLKYSDEIVCINIYTEITFFINNFDLCDPELNCSNKCEQYNL